MRKNKKSKLTETVIVTATLVASVALTIGAVVLLSPDLPREQACDHEGSARPKK